MIAQLVPGQAAQLVPELRPAAPARKAVETNGNVAVVTTSTSRSPAIPPPTPRAKEIAQQLAPYVAGEHLVAAEVACLAALARAAEALAAQRREISARLDRLEQQSE
jgi:hypothetical protein